MKKPRLLPAISLMTMFACMPPGGFDKVKPIDLDAVTTPVASNFSSEADLEQRYDSEILTGYAAGQAGTFEGVAGVPINYRVFTVPNEKGAIVFLPGRTEPILKHAENILDLLKQGYSVYAMDHRGQGASGRMLPDSQMGYVEAFADYVSDLSTFVDSVVHREQHSALFLLAHSMGGGISASYLLDHPDVFKAVVFSSPMLDVNTDPFPKSLADLIADGDCNWSSGQSFAIGQADFDANLKFEDKANDVTRSVPRFNLKQRMFGDNPTQRLGGVSYHWLCEALTQSANLPGYGYYSRTPTLIFQAGQDDIVMLPAQNKYCAAAANCQIKVYPDAFHEILSEKDSIRNDALARAVRFFNHYSAE